jgi:hypothetical protein
MDELTDALAGLTRAERLVIANACAERRELSAREQSAMSHAWARIWGLLAASASEATAREDRTLYMVSRTRCGHSRPWSLNN